VALCAADSEKVAAREITRARFFSLVIVFFRLPIFGR
jgi:hypothetical protein